MRLLPRRYHIYSNSIRKEHYADLTVMFDSRFARTRRFHLVAVVVNGTQSEDSFLYCVDSYDSISPMQSSTNADSPMVFHCVIAVGSFGHEVNGTTLLVLPATPTVTRHKQLSNLSNSCSEIFWTQNGKSRICRKKWRKDRETGWNMGSDRSNESTGFDRRELPDFAASSSIPRPKRRERRIIHHRRSH